ncbi:carboxymuconolactone decarboxylase family protein [Microbacterium halotolerans]|uniref:carboxymuconolactone decarboxylase family protein n=1 Tax=Microbacterium halotolerans TaxID=246613 RepID=UPI001F093E82|nr:carboxymuconolactone decarboxylase family protein [Microbacterium halotolerans]
MTSTRVHLNKTAPDAYKALSAFADTAARIAAENGVDDRVKELVLLHCSQLNGCAYCVRVHTDRAAKAGVGYDDLAQLPVWRESGVFSERERAALELAEAFTFIHSGGVSDDAYARATSVLTDAEYAGVSWLAVEINAFNRVVLASRLQTNPVARS